MKPKQYRHVAVAGLVLILALSIASSYAPAAHATDAVDRLEGPYGGAVLGVSYVTARVDREQGQGKRTFTDRSAAGGLFLGYNTRLGSSRWLLGVEADVTFADHDKRQADDVLDTVRLRQKWMSTVRARGGYVRNNAFIYGTIGLAISDLEIEPVNLGPHDALRAGLVLGLGSDLAIKNEWLVRVEGLGAFYPDEEVGFAGAERDVRYRHATIRFGVARKF